MLEYPQTPPTPPAPDTPMHPPSEAQPPHGAAKLRFEITHPRCPLGLRIMALVNFIIGTLGLIAVVGLAFGQDNRYEVFGHFRADGPVTWKHHLMIIMRLAAVMTIFFSGVGYLRLKRLQGWVLGNLYAIISLTNTLLYALLLKEFGTSSLLWLPFPIITLFALNTSYLRTFFPRAHQLGPTP
ncbi:MAG: hypothetical protein ACYS8X_11370 [Planctomycetota bacterium]